MQDGHVINLYVHAAYSDIRFFVVSASLCKEILHNTLQGVPFDIVQFIKIKIIK
jgi:hypothetical protein